MNTNSRNHKRNFFRLLFIHVSQIGLLWSCQYQSILENFNYYIINVPQYSRLYDKFTYARSNIQYMDIFSFFCARHIEQFNMSYFTSWKFKLWTVLNWKLVINYLKVLLFNWYSSWLVASCSLHVVFRIALTVTTNISIFIFNEISFILSKCATFAINRYLLADKTSELLLL